MKLPRRQVLKLAGAAAASALARPALAFDYPTPTAGSPADFGRFVAAETEKLSKVIRASGAKPD